MTAALPAPLGDAALADTWSFAWQAFARPVPLHLRLVLQAAWSERHRRYHDLVHLRECLALWTLWRGRCDRPEEVALALWFHDAIYGTSFKDNELQSASWAARSLGQAGVASEISQRVFDLVMATCHDAEPDGRDAQLLVDIDLAILGSSPGRFKAYDRDIRLEYEAVPRPKYREGRRRVLEGFLGREAIYRTDPARQLLETQARLNLRDALDRLDQ